MEFLFHSVVDDGNHTKYYNIYRIDNERFFAECHHFNRERVCEGDFELRKGGEAWTAAQPGFERAAQIIGEEIERLGHPAS
ncbi:MAG TPA: hypothetical protein VD996_04510 [Chitinophagaceae bacterium]|nr:hypothetical protein [Chitinophagaceae bacterium]